MRALVKSHAGPGLEVADVPEPHVGDSDVLIRVLRTGICGTDLHIDAWDEWAATTVAPPLVPGHEFSGEVVAVGPAVRDVAVGAIVSGEGHIVCGLCRNCRAGRRHLCARTSGVGIHRDGAFAEFVALPESNVWVHPPHIDRDTAAVFDPFGNAVHTALKFPVAGEDVLITGAGPIGLMAAAVVRHVGARFVVVTDVSEPRLELARKVGADLAVNVSTDTVAAAQRTLGMREGFDVGLEMSGHPSALPDMIANLSHGASVAMLGLPSGPIDVDWSKVVTHMLTVAGIYGREMFETWNAMSAMLESSTALGAALDTIITHRVPARDWHNGFAIAREASAGKVVLDWSQLP